MSLNRLQAVNQNKRAQGPSDTLFEIFKNQAELHKSRIGPSTTSSTQTSSLKKIYDQANLAQESGGEGIQLAHKATQHLQQREVMQQSVKASKRSPADELQLEAEKTPREDPLAIDHVKALRQARGQVEKLLQELYAEKFKIDENQDKDNTGALDEKIQHLEEALDALELLLKKISTKNEEESFLYSLKKHESTRHTGRENISSDEENDDVIINMDGSDDDSPPNESQRSNLGTLIARRTTTRRRPRVNDDSEALTTLEHTSRPNTVDDTQTQGDDLPRILNQEARKAIIKIDNKILDYSLRANQVLREIREYEKNIHESQQGSPKKNIEKLKNALEEKKFLYIQIARNIGALYMRRDELSRPFLSSPEKELPDPEHITDGLSERTHNLEKTYKNNLSAYIKQINDDPDVKQKAASWNRRAGFAAFGSSFFITNTVGRLIGLSAVAGFMPAWINPVFAPIAAGFFHTAIATPTAKQIMLRTWRSPVLAEMNNYFRLQGAYVHDKLSNKLDERKYASKNPENKDLLTIEERLNEERSFSDIFCERYKSEEMPYSAYTAMYSLKGIIEALVFPGNKPSPDTFLVIDTVAHAISGFASGAIYLHGQQSQRSERPGNIVDVIPTREIYQAQADWLMSRREDLSAMIKARQEIDKNDPTLRQLAIKLHKTEVALLTAVAKTGRFTSWWHDFKTQFKPEVLADTLADMAGRIIALYPTAVVNYFCTSLRASSNPLLFILGHALPAIALIEPPGFALRGIYGGFVRAMIQAAAGTGTAPTSHPATPVSAKEMLHNQEDDNSVIVTMSDEEAESWVGNPNEWDAQQV